jgi:hypothetical protein
MTQETSSLFARRWNRTEHFGITSCAKMEKSKGESKVLNMKGLPLSQKRHLILMKKGLEIAGPQSYCLI